MRCSFRGREQFAHLASFSPNASTRKNHISVPDYGTTSSPLDANRTSGLYAGVAPLSSSASKPLFVTYGGAADDLGPTAHFEDTAPALNRPSAER